MELLLKCSTLYITCLSHQLVRYLVEKFHLSMQLCIILYNTVLTYHRNHHKHVLSFPTKQIWCKQEYPQGWKPEQEWFQLAVARRGWSANTKPPKIWLSAPRSKPVGKNKMLYFNSSFSGFPAQMCHWLSPAEGSWKQRKWLCKAT